MKISEMQPHEAEYHLIKAIGVKEFVREFKIDVPFDDGIVGINDGYCYLSLEDDTKRSGMLIINPAKEYGVIFKLIEKHKMYIDFYNDSWECQLKSSTNFFVFRDENLINAIIKTALSSFYPSGEIND